MALGSLPPWLQISPSDYLHATQSGVSAGQAIAERNIRAFEEQQRIKMAGEHQQNVLAQQAIENAANRLAAERLEDYRHSEIANRQSQLGIEQQGLGLRGEGLDLRSQRITDLANAEKDRQTHQQQIMNIQQTQRDFMNDMRTREADRRDRESARLAANPQRLNPVDQGLLRADVAQLEGLNKQIGSTEEHGFGILHPLGGNKSQMDGLRKQADALRTKIKSAYGGGSRFVYNPTSGKIEPSQQVGSLPQTTDTGE